MKFRHLAGRLTFLATGLSASVAFAEGAAQVGTNQNLQATANLAMGTKTFRVGRLGVNIFDAATENIVWTGAGNLRIWAPSADPDTDPPTATLTTGQSFDTTENGDHVLELTANQGATAWDVSVTGSAPGFGRLYSQAWQFFTNSYGSGASTNASFYALVPAGESSKTGVIELKLDGMSGNQYVIAANQRGVDGANAGRSVSQTGNSFTPDYRVYLNPPEIATYDPVTPVASALDFSGGPLGCNEIGTGVSTGTFEFSSNITGTYHLVCDLNKDSIYNRVGSEDFLYVGLANPGTNTATWNGLDNAGDPVPDGDYECLVYLNTGEMHYVAWDIETAYKGLRMFEVAADLSEIGLYGFWNDSAIQANAIDMPNGEKGSQDSQALGVFSGLASDPAVADGVTTSGNAHAWGNFVNGGKGNNAFIDTFAFLRSTATGVVNVTTVDPAQDTDSDTLPDYQESCVIGTDPTNPDTDGDGIPDGSESGGGGGAGVDSDGDGVIDALDADSDNDGITDAEEGAADTDGDGILDVLDLDSDNDGIPDIVEQQLGAFDLDGDGRIDDITDDDGDGLANLVDTAPSDPSIATSIGPTVNSDGLADGPDRIDLDSDEDGLSDVFEGGGLDVDMDGHLDPTVDLNQDGLDDAVEPGGSFGPLPVPNTDSLGAPDFQQADSDGDGVGDDVDSDRLDPLVCSDADSDGCEDCSSSSFSLANDGPDNDLDGLCNIGDPDDDNDGAPDATDSDDNNPLVCADADADGCDECSSGTLATTALDGADNDLDGICNVGDPDDDNDGAPDASDRDDNDPDVCADSDADSCDDCASGSFDPAADGADFDADGLCDPGDPDDDNDGAPDGADSDDKDPNVCSDSDADSCDDCAGGTFNVATDGADFDADGLCDLGDPDDDNDGVPDSQDSDPKNANVCRDSDGDTCDDCAGGSVDALADGLDTDSDGLCDVGELASGSEPDDADSDDDGVPDGDEPDGNLDTDGDGLINRNDPDSDNDGLSDGTEMGLDCSASGTDIARGFCTPDADEGATVTDPLNPDTDGGGVLDGAEDTNLNGQRDTKETSPVSGDGDDDDPSADSDGDGLSDALERFLGSNPNDSDSDDDGVPDGDEPNPSLDMDGDGLIGLLDVDSDNDGLFDGTEMGRDCESSDTDVSLGHCRADADPSSQTSPLDPDSDHGGVSDGSEDANLNGAVDDGETNPEAGQGADDGDLADDDGDGLSNALEDFLGSDPNDTDSDNDGVPDGAEANPSDDHDGDGRINLLDEDSDGDGLFDGTEVGNDCAAADIDLSQEVCVPDGDQGATVTGPLSADTDGGGVIDGDEDTNRDGVVDSGELDPNDADDDAGCRSDDECGDVTSGLVCEAGACVEGCRGSAGNGCPSGLVCSSNDDTAGSCSPEDTSPGTGGTDGAAGSGPTEEPTLVVRGGGISCAYGEPARDPGRWPWLLLAGAGILLMRRRRAA